MSDYKKILVAIDFSSISEKLVQKALTVNKLFNAEIVLVHIIDYSPPSYISVEIPEIYTSEDLMKERAEQNMKEIVAKVTDMDIETIVRVGKRKSTLVSVADEIGADLAILGKHDPDITEKILGSTTHATVNAANCDLLIVHG